jgi:hypothetical protein
VTRDDPCNTISAIYPEFEASMSYDLLRKEMAKEPLPKLEDLIETFQNYARLYPTQPTPLSTFSASLSMTGPTTPTCICRALHWYSDCLYFNPAIRKPN